MTTNRASAATVGVHTPGPWEARGLTVFEVGKTALSVATITQHQPASRANASLIAAAPELLEVLQTMVRAGRLGCDAFDFLAAERAIAKATGQ